MIAGIFIGMGIGIAISGLVLYFAICQVSRELERKEHIYDNDNEFYY